MSEVKRDVCHACVSLPRETHCPVCDPEMGCRKELDTQRLRADTAKAEVARLEEEFDTGEHALITLKLKLDAAERRNAALASKWIKCSDELPEIGKPVLIRIPTCGHWNVESGKYEGDGLWEGAWCSTRGEGKCYKVTQWAEMPEETDAALNQKSEGESQ